MRGENDEPGADRESVVPEESRLKESYYRPLGPNIESAINSLIVFVGDGWPEHYREGARRSLRREIREALEAAEKRGYEDGASGIRLEFDPL